MRFRVLSWNDEAGKNLVTAVVKECDAVDVEVKRNRVGFRCDDSAMVAIISSLRDVLNKNVFITFI